MRVVVVFTRFRVVLSLYNQFIIHQKKFHAKLGQLELFA